MKRAFAVCGVLAALVFSAFGIGTFSGKWDAGIQLLPKDDLALTKNVLTIKYTDFGWTFTGKLSLLGGENDTFKASVDGALGLVSVVGNMDFDFDQAAYTKSDLTMKMDFAGVGLGLKVAHKLTAAAYEMKYTLSAKVPPISTGIVFVDKGQGTTFDKLTTTIKDIGLCCSISLTAEYTFTADAGFKSLKFSGIEIPICCGVSLTAGVEFTPTTKTLETGLEFAGLGDACFAVYADVLGEAPQWTGIQVYGWKIKCTLGDCSYVEFLSALSPDNLPSKIKKELAGKEFEWVKLGFCGAGCCGGNYKADLAVYFGSDGKLFDITRIAANMAIPVMTNLDASVSFTTALDGKHTLEVGWTFKF